MPVRTRKLIGAVVLIVLVIVYAVVATAMATLYLPTASGWVHLAYFFFTGILWVVPAMFIIAWMERVPRKDRAGGNETRR
ncbi:DUF2842 domain-containing protein [Aurantimonas manganoxydans]|uniref:DUF2842 domain-containing protein n=1 Tax=Aurantimonas manganoxydans TaxID=651183 RepID=UPI00031D995E|nr:DUF2842 domain-containing protein [Aurantimonas manganoxydans]